MELDWNDGPFRKFQFALSSKDEILLIRSIFSITFIFMNPYPLSCFFFKFLKKFLCFYSRLNAQSDKPTLDFYKPMENNQKLKKLNSSLKTQIYNIRCLKLQKEIKIMELDWKDGPFRTFQFVLSSNDEIVSIRSIFRISFIFMNL